MGNQAIELMHAPLLPLKRFISLFFIIFFGTISLNPFPKKNLMKIWIINTKFLSLPLSFSPCSLRSRAIRRVPTSLSLSFPSSLQSFSLIN